ncbi:DUF4333 domain-containing protein [Prauserella muralis]|uniref:DUF4333 domain-containing protein n=1 Tax=Prauserella muralis TaxID=588067 RepID=A0A2V4BA17_9PSEU|nr:DUF4333 domain-containing protein [Prauserella muralis]PXY30949.1 hypothetical protein BAY60_00490 [Prauserella muralis]TWE14796.1 uncharacterized protein DUF4333 [Prauserella muralis]
MLDTRRLLLVPVFVALAVAGCSAEVKTENKVSPENLQTSVADALEKQVGQRPESIDCPEGIDAEQGAKARCVLEHQGTRYGVSVTVTSAEGGNVKYDVQVDDQPMK